MTLNDAKILLSENNIVFDLHEYENEATYWHHRMLFPYTKNARNCKVITLVVASNNQNKHIKLQFKFDYNEKMLADDLLEGIKEMLLHNSYPPFVE